MATGTAGTTARKYHTAQSHYLIVPISYADGDGTVYALGTVPANSVIKKSGSGVHPSVVFNAGTLNTIDIGTVGTPTLYGSALSLLTATFVATAQATGAYIVTVDTPVVATIHLTGTAPTTGTGYVWVEYLPLYPG
jgi:hypothetical protein